MKRRAYAKRRDANEPDIVNALRKVGATVKRLDFFDLLVGYKGKNYLIEVKTEKGKLTNAQVDEFKTWRGDAHIAVTIDDALQIIGAV